MKKKTNLDLKQLSIFIIIAIIIVVSRYVTKQEEQNITTETTNQSTISENISQNSNIKITDIPEYSGEIIIDINENIPYFTDEEIKTEEFEIYSNLDELGRAGVAYANICKFTMPPEGIKRESLSYKPSGWIQYLYGENNSKHLYERCHLIAWQLGNENNNKNNLITGTSNMNSAMIPYENMIANWIKNKNKEGKDYHVLYRVTPIYEGENLLAKGVEIEAKSVEEEGIVFNKFIYNVQEGFEINYETGKAEKLE